MFDGFWLQLSGDDVAYFTKVKIYFLFVISLITKTKSKYRNGMGLEKLGIGALVYVCPFWSIKYFTYHFFFKLTMIKTLFPPFVYHILIYLFHNLRLFSWSIPPYSLLKCNN